MTWRRSAVSSAALSVARGSSDGAGAPDFGLQNGDGVEQLTAMPENCDAKILQVLAVKLGRTTR